MEHNLTISTIKADVAPQRLCQWDPLARVLLSTRWPMISILAILLYGSLDLGLGVWISLMRPDRDIAFLPIWDHRELPLVLFGDLLAAPVIWSLYVYQLRAFSDVFASLERNGVVRNDQQSIGPMALMSGSFNSSTNVVLVILLALGMAIGWLSAALSPSDPLRYGYDSSWNLIDTRYFFGILCPLLGIGIWMLAWMTVRQLRIYEALHEFYNNFHIDPKIFHHDHCNGLGAMRHLAIGAGLLDLVLGLWLSLAVIYPQLAGTGPNLKPDTLIMVVMFTLLVPALLFSIIWPAHTAMLRTKRARLERLAVIIRASMDTTMPRSTIAEIRSLASMMRARELERLYRLAQQEYRTWPFDRLEIPGFSIASLMPAIVAIISFMSRTRQ